MAFSADSPFVFVTLQESDEIAAIRLADQTLAWKMKVNRLPAGIWLTPDVRHLLVGVMGADDVEEIDWRAQKSAKRIVTGKGARNFCPLGDGRHIFVGNRVAGTVGVIEQATREKKYDVVVPNGPDCMEVSADGKWLWVTQRWGKSVAVVDIEARRIAQSIPAGRSSRGIFFANSAPWRQPGRGDVDADRRAVARAAGGRAGHGARCPHRCRAGIGGVVHEARLPDAGHRQHGARHEDRRHPAPAGRARDILPGQRNDAARRRFARPPPGPRTGRPAPTKAMPSMGSSHDYGDGFWRQQWLGLRRMFDPAA